MTAEPARPPAPPPHDWEGRWRSGDTPWDLGGPPPVLLRLLEELSGRDLRLRVLVPGAGAGHDAFAWAAAGHEVTAIDVAPSAVARAVARARELRVVLDVVLADLFDLPAALVAGFDAVWEQTCFCAVPVDRRAAYVGAMARALRPGGTFYGLFWNHGRPGGPPYDVTPGQVRDVFLPRFAEVHVEPVEGSVPARKPEFLATLLRR